jgi:hypothetical protein
MGDGTTLPVEPGSVVPAELKSLIGRLGGSVPFFDHALRKSFVAVDAVHVCDAAASSKRSVMPTALPARAPTTPSRHTPSGGSVGHRLMRPPRVARPDSRSPSRSWQRSLQALLAIV